MDFKRMVPLFKKIRTAVWKIETEISSWFLAPLTNRDCALFCYMLVKPIILLRNMLYTFYLSLSHFCSFRNPDKFTGRAIVELAHHRNRLLAPNQVTQLLIALVHASQSRRDNRMLATAC
jgi:hypothetical protein